MMSLVPTFGIDAYAERVALLMIDAPRQMPIIEGVVLAGLAAVAGVLLIVALFRQSAVAAVGFSFLALTGLVCGLLFGRLDFVPPTTQVLLLCLAACAQLLFITATIRVARDNPLVGLVVLIGLAVLLAVGGASATGMLEGGMSMMRLGVAGTFALTLICLIIEAVRRHRPSLIVAPGLIAVMVSPGLMAMISNSAAADPFIVASPILVLAAGALYSTVAALTVLAFAKKPDDETIVKVREAKPRRMKPVPQPVPMMREVEEDLAPKPGPHFARKRQAAVQEEPIYEAEEITPLSDAAGDPEPAPEVLNEEDPFAAGPISTLEDVTPQATRHNYAATPAPVRHRPEPEPMPEPVQHYAPEPQPVVEPEPSYPPEPEHIPQATFQTRNPAFEPAEQYQEPVSSHWGARNTSVVPAPIVAPDEYVWDQLAEQEVKVGKEFSGMFGLPDGLIATPDVLRDAVAPGSLDDFDDQILGGRAPQTGRFDIELAVAAGGVVRLEGRRQVDHDGLLLRIEAMAQQVKAAPKPASQQSAQTAAPLTASRPGARGAKAQGDLEGAIERGEIEAHFQPIVRLADRVTVGFEALARWRQMDGTVVEAKDFVPELMKLGKGMDLAELVLNLAARELSAWIAAEPGQGQFVAVNISAADLPKDEIALIVQKSVKAYALPPGALVVELTEDKIQASQSKALAAAKAVRQAGASLAIDDFGVGYSTLNRLSKFHFDLIKTDRSLIADLSGKKARAFMKTLLETAQKQGAPVIAEGIENEETAQMLAEMGCAFGQGYLFGRAEALGAPAPAEPAPAEGVGILR